MREVSPTSEDSLFASRSNKMKHPRRSLKFLAGFEPRILGLVGGQGYF